MEMDFLGKTMNFVNATPVNGKLENVFSYSVSSHVMSELGYVNNLVSVM